MIPRSILGLNLASAALVLSSRPEPLVGEGTGPVINIESVVKPAEFYADKMMREWQEEDRKRAVDKFALTLCPSISSSVEDEMFLRAADEVVNATNCSPKNLSPYRVSNRRQKNKVARKSRRRNRTKK